MKKLIQIYSERGWCMVPLTWPDIISDYAASERNTSWIKAPGKQPLFSEWQKNPTSDATQIQSLLVKYPRMNLGILTGACSKMLVVDIDGPEGEASITALQEDNGAFPSTLEQITGGGGRHLLFNYPAQLKIGNVNVRKWLPAVDIRGNGGQIVVAPSVHPKTGLQYSWKTDPATTELADLPEWFLGMLVKPIKPAKDTVTVTNGSFGFELPPEVHEGERDDTMFRLICSLRSKDLSEKAVLAAVLIENEARFKPSLESDLVSDKVKRVFANYSVGDFPYYTTPQATSFETLDITTPVALDTTATPQFPIAAFDTIPWLKELVESLSYIYQTPTDLAGTMSLAAIAAVSAGLIEVCRTSDHREPTNLFTFVIMDPSTRKSPLVAFFKEPFRNAEKHQREIVLPKIAIHKEHLKSEKKKLDIMQKELSTAKAALERLDEQADKVYRIESNVPVVPIFLVDDHTPESLGKILSEQVGNKVAILHAEAAIAMTAMSGQYSSKPNFSLYLSAYTGESYRYDRMGRPSSLIDRPLLTIGVCGQPSMIENLVSDVHYSDMRGRGLYSRFLFSYPESLLGLRRTDIEESVDATAVINYGNFIAFLLNETMPPKPQQIYLD